MTSATQNFYKWYNENVSTFSLDAFMVTLIKDGYAHHFTDDGKLFKVIYNDDNSIEIHIMKDKLSLFRMDYRERLNEIIPSMIRSTSYDIHPQNIGDFASWCANDILDIDNCGITFSDWTYYLVYEDELDDSIDVIHITHSNDNVEENENNEVISYSVTDEQMRKLWIEMYDIKNKIDNLVKIWEK